MPITKLRNTVPCSLTYFVVFFVIGQPIGSTQHEGREKRQEFAIFFLVSRSLLFLLLLFFFFFFFFFTLSKLPTTQRGVEPISPPPPFFFSLGRDLEKCVLQQWKFVLNFTKRTNDFLGASQTKLTVSVKRARIYIDCKFFNL